MKLRDVTIKVASLEQSLKDFEKAVKKARKTGERLDPIIAFGNKELLQQTFTEKRIELLRIIKEEHPRSLYELAKLSHRDLRNVRDDVKALHKAGILKLKRNKTNRNALQPELKYNTIRIELTI